MSAHGPASRSLVDHALCGVDRALRVEVPGARGLASLRVERSPCGRGRLIWAGEPRGAGEPRVWFRTIDRSHALAWWLAPGRPRLPLVLDTSPLAAGATWPRRVLEALRPPTAPSPWRGGSTYLIEERARATAHDAPLVIDTLIRYASEATFDWSWGFELLPTRTVSAREHARVRWYRKLARRGALPPVITLAWHAARAEIVIDGHDRLLASLLEGAWPTIVCITEVRRRRPLEEDVALTHTQASTLLAQRMGSAHGERVRDETASNLAMLPWSRLAYRDALSASPLSVAPEVWEREVRFLARATGRTIPSDLLRP